MPAEEQVTISIIAKDAASKAFKSFATEAEKAGQKVEKSFGDKLKQVGDTATKVGKGLSIGVTAPLALYAGVATNAAIKSERLTKTLTGLAGGAEEAEKYVKAIGEASLGTVARVDALAAANRALSFGVVKNTDEMKTLTEVAITLGRAQGLDAKQAVNDFTTALSRNSPMILDNLGITLKLTEAYKIYADKIGKSADALNAEEKAIAFREAALIKGMEAVERMGGLQDDMAASGERLKAQMEDLSVKVGTMLIPVMSQGISVVGPLVQKFAEMDPEGQKVVVILGAIAAAAGPVIGTFGKLLSTTTDLAGGAANLAKTMGLTGSALGGLGLAAGAVVGGYALFQAAQSDLKKEHQESTIAVQEWIVKIQEAKVAGEGMEDAIIGIANEIDDFNKKWESSNVVAKAFNDNRDIVKDFASDAHTAIKDVSQSYKEYLSMVDEFNAATDDQTAHIKEQTIAHTRGGGEIKTMREEMVLLTEAQFYNLRATESMSDEMNRMSQMYVQTGQELERTAEVTDYTAERMQALGRHAGEAGSITVSKAREIREELAADAEHAGKVAQAFEDMAARNAAALASQQAAAEEAARAQAGLIGQMQGATEEMFKQAVLGEIDPATIGVEAYATLGQELGLIDEKAVNLASAIEQLVPALEDGTIPLENAGEAVHELFVAADEANPPIQAILDKFSDAPGLIGPSHDALVEHHGVLEDMVNILPDATTGVDDFATSAGDAEGPVDDLRQRVEELQEYLALVEGDHTVNVNTTYTQTGTPPPSGATGGTRPPPHQLGGLVAGPIGSPQLVLAHGGEYIINPFHRGAMGGPGGPPAPVSNSYGGDTFNVTINDRMAAALFMEQARQNRLARWNARV